MAELRDDAVEAFRLLEIAHVTSSWNRDQRRIRVCILELARDVERRTFVQLSPDHLAHSRLRQWIMPLHFDPQRLPSYDQSVLAELVRSIAESGDPDAERHWIEWKSKLNLQSKPGRAELAKEVLAMANRAVLDARSYCHGWGYVVVGADETGIHGLPIMSTAALENALNEYLGRGSDSPRWEPRWVTLGGASVLIICVEPPRDGDPIFALQKTSDKLTAGTVFTRGIEQSRPAGPQELRMLQSRLLSGTSKERVMERLAFVCSSLRLDIQFQAPIMLAQAFAVVSRPAPGLVSIWVEFFESGAFEEPMNNRERLRDPPTNHLLVITPEWARSPIAAAKRAVENAYGNLSNTQLQGHMIAFCDSSFGSIHSTLNLLTAIGPEGKPFPRLNLQSFHLPER